MAQGKYHLGFDTPQAAARRGKNYIKPGDTLVARIRPKQATRLMRAGRTKHHRALYRSKPNSVPRYRYGTRLVIVRDWGMLQRY